MRVTEPLQQADLRRVSGHQLRADLRLGLPTHAAAEQEEGTSHHLHRTGRLLFTPEPNRLGVHNPYPKQKFCAKKRLSQVIVLQGKASLIRIYAKLSVVTRLA